MKKYENCIIFLMGFTATGKYTIGKILEKHPNFKLIDDASVNDTIYSLVSLNEKKPLAPPIVEKINALWELYFKSIEDAAPQSLSYIITQEMIEDEQSAQLFYQRLLTLIEKRKSLFVPVRLICNEDELLKRVMMEERRSTYEGTTVDRAIDLTRNHKVFTTHHPNELTINNTEVYPGEVAKTIIAHIDAIQLTL